MQARVALGVTETRSSKADGAERTAWYAETYGPDNKIEAAAATSGLLRHGAVGESEGRKRGLSVESGHHHRFLPQAEIRQLVTNAQGSQTV